ncbi:MAG TPA: hypothetical protein VES20_22270, partial [Bryobacteraceae bacterium]|nr:hypothetical protein [Bryobacteraceae bacterium]
PFGRGKRFMGNAPGVVNAILGGWQLSGAHRYASGVPLSPSARCPSLEFVNASARCRPSYTGVPELYGPGKDDIDPSSNVPYVNPAAFTVPAPYTFGTVERNVSRLRTMPSLNENVGVFKNFDFSERARFQFRAEAFNILNRVIFSAPDMLVGTYNASQPGNIERNPRFGFFAGQSNTPRVIQLGAKLIF